MLAGENLARIIHQLRLESGKSLTELSEELDIPRTSLKKIASGCSNPRLDTLVLLSEKLGVSIAELVSGPLPGWEKAEAAVRVARMFSDLTPEQQEVGTQLFLQLVALFTKDK